MDKLNQIQLRIPDDWHLHLRDGEMLKAVLPHTEQYFSRAIVMPNLQPPVVTTSDAIAYRNRIKDAGSSDTQFHPLMTVYLTENTDPQDIKNGFENGELTAVKFYPAGATTNSNQGVSNIEKVNHVLECLETIEMPLLIHCEVVDPDVDVFDREAVFIDRVLEPICRRFPKLRIVFEHATTQEAVQFVQSQKHNIAATITPMHLILNRNDILVGGIHPHKYCLPVAKREHHRLALRQAVISGDPCFFLGTDSAPHLDQAKECASGCAGIFNIPVCMSILAHVFEEEGVLDKMEAFTSIYGPQFYQLPPNDRRIFLEKSDTPLNFPKQIDTASGKVTVFDPGFPLYWQVVQGEN